jgi:hypothetical protein
LIDSIGAIVVAARVGGIILPAFGCSKGDLGSSVLVANRGYGLQHLPLRRNCKDPNLEHLSLIEIFHEFQHLKGILIDEVEERDGYRNLAFLRRYFVDTDRIVPKSYGVLKS